MLTTSRRAFHFAHSAASAISGPDVVPVIESTTNPVASFEESVIMSLTARTSSGLSESLPASFCDS